MGMQDVCPTAWWLPGLVSRRSWIAKRGYEGDGDQVTVWDPAADPPPPERSAEVIYIGCHRVAVRFNDELARQPNATLREKVAWVLPQHVWR